MWNREEEEDHGDLTSVCCSGGLRRKPGTGARGRPPNQQWVLPLAMGTIRDLGQDGIMVVFAKNPLDALWAGMGRRYSDNGDAVVRCSV